MSVGLRPVWLAAWSGVGLALIWLLFSRLGITLGEAMSSVTQAPLWLFAVVGLLTLANKIIGTLKWKVSARYLAQPVDGPGFWRLVEMTNLGALFGQFIPVQLSTLLVRWFLLDRKARSSGHVIGATFFEQAFDLILVSSGAVAGIAAFGLGLTPAGVVGTFFGVVGITVVALRPLMRIASVICSAGARVALLSRVCEGAAAGFARAAAAPTSVVLTLAGYSLARLIVVGLRAVVVMAVFAPSTLSWLVFAATPAVSLITALPITPGGLGVAEWTWSAVLVAGGTTAASAALAALALRLVTFVTMVLIGLGLVALRPVLDGVSRSATTERGT